MMRDVSLKDYTGIPNERIFNKVQDFLWDEELSKHCLHPEILDVVEAFTGNYFLFKFFQLTNSILFYFSIFLFLHLFFRSRYQSNAHNVNQQTPRFWKKDFQTSNAPSEFNEITYIFFHNVPRVRRLGIISRGKSKF